MARLGVGPDIWPGPEGSCRRWYRKYPPMNESNQPCPKKCFEPNDGPCCDYELIVPQLDPVSDMPGEKTVRINPAPPEHSGGAPATGRASPAPTATSAGQSPKASTDQTLPPPTEPPPAATPPPEPPQNQIELEFEGPVRHLIDVQRECCRPSPYQMRETEEKCPQINPCCSQCRPLQTSLHLKELGKFPRQKPTYKHSVSLDEDTLVGRVFPMKFRLRRICNKCTECGNELYIRHPITDNNNLLLISNCCNIEVYPQKKVDNMHRVPVSTINGPLQRFTKRVIEEPSNFRLFPLPVPEPIPPPADKPKDPLISSKRKSKKGKKGKKGKGKGKKGKKGKKK